MGGQKTSPGFSPKFVRRFRSHTTSWSEDGEKSSSRGAKASTTRARSISSPSKMRRKSQKCDAIMPFRVLLLGQGSVGKTAFAVRLIAGKFIGEYDPTLEKQYPPTMMSIDGEQVGIEIYDTAGQVGIDEKQLNHKVNWADAFLLVYSIADKCSFNDMTRYRFLINLHASKNRTPKYGHWRSVTTSHFTHEESTVMMVGNKKDLECDRMVSFEEGKRMSRNIGCSDFQELSVRDSYQDVKDAVAKLYRIWKTSQCKDKGIHKRSQQITAPVRDISHESRSSSDEAGNKMSSSPPSATDTPTNRSLSRKLSSVFLRKIHSRSTPPSEQSRREREPPMERNNIT